MIHDKDKPTKTYILDVLFPFPFDKSIDMYPFSRGFEVPMYNIYFGTANPQDNLKEFGALSIEFMHNQTYLMHLFPRSLGD